MLFLASGGSTPAGVTSPDNVVNVPDVVVVHKIDQVPEAPACSSWLCPPACFFLALLWRREACSHGTAAQLTRSLVQLAPMHPDGLLPAYIQDIPSCCRFSSRRKS